MRRAATAALLLALAGCSAKLDAHAKVDSKPSEPDPEPKESFLQQSQGSIAKFMSQLGLTGEPSCYELVISGEKDTSTIHCTLAERLAGKRIIHEFECNADGCLYKSNREY